MADNDEGSSEGEGDSQLLLVGPRTADPAADAVVAVEQDKDEDIDAIPIHLPVRFSGDDLPMHEPPRSKVDIQGTNGPPHKDGSYPHLATSAHLDLNTRPSVLQVDPTPEHRKADGLPPASASRVCNVFAELHDRPTEQGSFSDGDERRGQSRNMSSSVRSISEQSPRDRSSPMTDEIRYDLRLDAGSPTIAA